MRWLPILVLSLAACGAPELSERTAPTSSALVGAGGEPQPSDDVRQLAPDAQFSDLLDAARILDDRRDQESNAGCLLRPGFRLEADLAVAVRPLPAAPEDLDEQLAHASGPVNVLSRFGLYGVGEPSAPTFAAITSTLPPRREPAVVWVLTDQGVHVRSSDGSMVYGPLSPEELAAPSADVGALFVTAESNVSLERLAEVLARIPPQLAGRIALAVALAPGTRLPEAPAEVQSADEDAGLCPEGLPELTEEVALGDLCPELIVERLEPLRRGAESCVVGARGPGAAGGRVVLAMRIGPDGRVQEACVRDDETGDPELRECLVRAARSVVLPAPNPPGVVDVELPLALAPLPIQRQAPLCP